MKTKFTVYNIEDVIAASWHCVVSTNEIFSGEKTGFASEIKAMLWARRGISRCLEEAEDRTEEQK